jgi:hypothetical protein
MAINSNGQVVSSGTSKRGIYSAIINVMAEIGVIGKDGKNKSQGYSFRGIDQVYNACHEAMVKHKVFCTPEVISTERTERPSKQGGVLFCTLSTVRYTFYTEDGSSVSCVTTGEGMDSGDKSANKALSGAQKYAFFQMFCIPTEEKKDSEHDSPEVVDEGELLDEFALIEKVNTSKNIHELKARWAKYAKDIAALEPQIRKGLAELKNEKKKELEAK